MKRDSGTKGRAAVMQSGLYVLKHKDMDVAMVQIDRVTGRIEYVLEIYLPQELPVGVDGGGIAEEYQGRANRKMGNNMEELADEQGDAAARRRDGTAGVDV